MYLLLVVCIACCLPWCAISDCSTCPDGCLCDPEETTCEEILYVPYCLPISTKQLTIVWSELNQIGSNNFADKSYANLEKITINDSTIYAIEDFAFNGSHRIRNIEVNNADGYLSLTEYSTYGLFELQRFEASNTSNTYTVIKSIGYHTFSSMRNLETLTLNGVGLEFIDAQAIEFAFRLKHFDVSNNPLLKSIPRKLLSHLSSLRSIRMNYCSLSTFYKDYFYASFRTNALVDIQAEGNEWACDEEMCPFLKWLSNSPDGKDFQSNFDLGLAFCNVPDEMSNTRLANAFSYAHAHGFCGDSLSKINSIYLYTVIMIVPCLVFLTITCICVCRRREIATHLCCCMSHDQSYSHIDDESTDHVINRPEVGSPDPPNYEESVREFASSPEDGQLHVNEDSIPSPNEV